MIHYTHVQILILNDYYVAKYFLFIGIYRNLGSLKEVISHRMYLFVYVHCCLRQSFRHSATEMLLSLLPTITTEKNELTTKYAGVGCSSLARIRRFTTTLQIADADGGLEDHCRNPLRLILIYSVYFSN